MPRLVPPVVVFAVLFAVAPLARADGDLAEKLEAVLDGPDYKAAHWGVLVVDAKTGETLYARNADKMFAPASVTKLFSCAAAFVELGADHRFVTPVYRRGETSEGTLRGDLVLVAQGDLTFGGRTRKDGTVAFRNSDHTYANGTSTEYELTDTDPRTAFDDLARQVKKAGITRIDGDVLIDDRLFATARSTGSGPRAVGPVIVNDNVIDLLVEPGAKEGDPAKVTIRPETAYVRADFDFRTGKANGPRTLTFHDDNPRNLIVSGVVPAGTKPVVVIVPVERPAELARVMLIEALERAGVRVSASVLSPLPDRSTLPAKDGYGKLTKVAAYTSPPLIDALTVTLKVSHNLYASTLPLLLTTQRGKERTLPAGLRAQGAVLKELGLDVSAISFAGGAGGANADHVTPRAAVQLLRLLHGRPDWDAYKAALPVLGVDGTLATVVSSNSPARGKVFAKTGTLYWEDSLNGRSLLTSKALAGTMTTRDGRELFIAMFVNNVPLPKGVRTTREGKVLGKLCELIHEHAPAGQ
jgi:D-alanyl-D-alanine carboxypeptidase/D-alanyl-D-alanine-endopeptidase (penicillin-binding protein 4)